MADRIKAVGSDAKLRGRLVRKVRAEHRKGSAGCEGGRFDGKKVAAALADLAASWDGLPAGEQRRVITVLVERIEHHAGREVVGITFRPSGIADLAGETV